MYVLARVTVKSLKTLVSYPGMEGCHLPPDSALVHSNVYSTAETCLLAWATSHYYKVQLCLQYPSVSAVAVTINYFFSRRLFMPCLPLPIVLLILVFLTQTSHTYDSGRGAGCHS